MLKADLHDSLEALKLEIELLDDTPENTRVYLVSLVNAIEKITDSDDEDEQHSLKESVFEIVESYQIEHPKVAAITQDIVNKLMSMGV